MKYLLILTFLPLSFFLTAQERGGERGSKVEYSKKMEAQKIAFFTTKLDLTPEESQTFWPVYNEYSKQVKSIRAEAKKGKMNAGGKKQTKESGSRAILENMTEEEASKGIEQMMHLKEKELNLQKSYVDKFKEVLPTKKVLMLFYLENKFKEQMMRDIRKKLSHQKNGRRDGTKKEQSQEKN